MTFFECQKTEKYSVYISLTDVWKCEDREKDKEIAAKCLLVFEGIMIHNEWTKE